MAALMSLLINKHGQKGRHLNKCRAYTVILKDVKSKRGKSRKKLQPSQETFK